MDLESKFELFACCRAAELAGIGRRPLIFPASVDAREVVPGVWNIFAERPDPVALITSRDRAVINKDGAFIQRYG